MKKIILALIVALGVILIPTLEARQTFVEGFNFRETAAYRTDGANQTYVLATDTYPVTRAGVTFGWTVAPTGCRDRDATIDVRLAGICFGSGVGTFRVDLPGAGTYDVRIANGDGGAGGAVQTATKILVKDNVTTKLTIGPHNTGAEWFDATNVSRTATTWPTSNVAASVAFASTSVFVTLETATTNSVLAHLNISGSPSVASTRRKRKLFGIGDN